MTEHVLTALLWFSIACGIGWTYLAIDIPTTLKQRKAGHR